MTSCGTISNKRQNSIYISLISKLEVLGYYRLKPSDKAELEYLLDAASILPITESIITEAIHLRQQRKRSLGDSIIAATALLYDLPLLTNNTADFEDIPGLQVIPLQSIN
jgi:predicted nucleic acid-binding protein